MDRGKDWGELEFNEDDTFYEEMLSDLALLENESEEVVEGEVDEEKGEQKIWLASNLKTRIRQIEEDLMGMWRSKVELAFEMGLKLHDFKGALSGGFKKAVNERLPFSYSTAISYMNVAERFKSAEEAALFDSKVMYAMATSQFPWRVRDEMVSKAKDGEIVTIEEVREARDEYKERREAASGIDDDTEVIEFKKTQCVEMMEHVKDSLEGIVSEVESTPWPEELSITEKGHQYTIWTLLERLAEVFEPED